MLSLRRGSPEPHFNPGSGPYKDLIHDWSGGDLSARGRLTNLIHDELVRMIAQSSPSCSFASQRNALHDRMFGMNDRHYRAYFCSAAAPAIRKIMARGTRVDEALTILEWIDSRYAAVVEMLLFGGMSIDDIAVVMKISWIEVLQMSQGGYAFIWRIIRK